jgi:flagellar hook-length control protein FliK
MTISPMVSPTASATVKNAAPAIDLAPDAQISATTGFSGLLAQEMAARHNALENAGAEAAESGKGAREASTTSAVDSNLPLDSSISGAGAEARENVLATRAIGIRASSTAAETVPALANSLATRHPNSANSGRLPSAASESHFEGPDRAKVDDRAAVSEFATIGDPADIQARSRVDDQQRDQSVPDGAPQMEIAASSSPQQQVRIAAVQLAQPEPSPVAMPALPPVPGGSTSFATSSAKKDPAIAAKDSSRSDSPISAEVSATTGAPGALRQAVAGRSFSAGDKLSRPDWGTGQANFPPFDPRSQAPGSTLDVAPLPKPLQDLSFPPQPPTVAAEIPLTSLVVEAAASSMASTTEIGFSGDSTQLGPRLGDASWDNALGQKVLWMVSQQQQVAELTLNPPDLGPLQVVLSISNDEASATFVSQHADVRQALEAALPRLKEMMAESGITLNSATVGQEGARQQSGFDQQNHSGGQRGGRAHIGGPEVSNGAGSVLIEPPGRSRLVDTFA